ncbi:hypothetical protein JRO89_XS01G0406600 [Xanthoceras sorbifolium]|uniref:RRM domain-containing protein n=1 Tax=Xanthoceras sorbifolium TaxID=99658 RepID=A0ABQ8IQ37_9ROSI|nr:hypothetical protein JRO89_XS01G0406600 [Xanthoceras sorbifolium]
MAALEAATLSISSLCASSLFNSCSSPKSPPPSSSSIKLFHIFNSTSSLSLTFSLSPSTNPIRKPCLQLCSTAQETTLEVERDQTQTQNLRKKLYVFNLPWAFSVADIKNLFVQCGTVVDVEIIKHKDGKNRNFAFVTMASGEEAQAAIDKFDAQDVSGRIIRVEFAKKFKKARHSSPGPTGPPSPPSSPAGETRHKIYVSNLAWKVRSSQLREFFSANFNPVSAKVVFESDQRRSAGYGFVSFATKEEAEAAISSLDGKELMGRPLRLKFNQKNVDESESEKQEEGISEDCPAVS